MTWVYQLRDRKAADAADYQTLLRNADTVLKDDVLASKSLLVMPKGSVTLNMPMDEDAQFVAVVGLFNRPDQKDNRWRLVLTRDDLDPDKPRTEAVLFSAPEGMVLTSGEDMQLAASRNLAVNAGEGFSVGVMGNATLLTGEKLGLFARTGQLSLKSGEGPVDVQAQNASMRLFAEKKLTLSSASDISFAGKKRITLIGGGSYLRLEAGKVEYGTTASYIRKVKRTMAAGSNSQTPEIPFLPGPGDVFRRSFILVDDRTQEPISNIRYELTSPTGSVVKGVSCEKGLTGFVSHPDEAEVELNILEKNSLFIG